MKRLRALPEPYLRFLLEPTAEEAQLLPYLASRPSLPKAYWQQADARQCEEDDAERYLNDCRLTVDAFDLDGFLPELEIAERFQLLLRLLADHPEILWDVVGLKRLSNERLRVSLRSMECQGAHPHDEYVALLAVFVHSGFLTRMRDSPLVSAFSDQVCNMAFGMRNVSEGAPARLHGQVILFGIPLDSPVPVSRRLHLCNGGC